MYIAIDAGATYIRIAAADSLDQQIFDNKIVLETKNNFGQDFGQIAESIHKLASENPQAIGVGLPAVLNKEKNQLVKVINIPTWAGQPLQENLEKEFHCKVVLENDVAAASIGETRLNTYLDDFLFISWGSGIGGSYAKYFADHYHVFNAEPGHQIIENGGRDCHCGQKGCLETYCGGVYIKKYFGKKVNELDESSWKEVAESFSLGLVNLIAILQPKKIVFAGGVSFDSENKIEEIEKLVSKKLHILPLPIIEISKLRENIGLYGALSLLKS